MYDSSYGQCFSDIHFWLVVNGVVSNICMSFQVWDYFMVLLSKFWICIRWMSSLNFMIWKYQTISKIACTSFISESIIEMKIMCNSILFYSVSWNKVNFKNRVFKFEMLHAILCMCQWISDGHIWRLVNSVV